MNHVKSTWPEIALGSFVTATTAPTMPVSDSTLRLSEAMRLGAMCYGQAFNTMWKLGINDEVQICALGAALVSAGCLKIPASAPPVMVSAAPPHWMFLFQHRSCPQCHYRSLTWGDMFHPGAMLIAHLNDTHRWTRERIADFIELHESVMTEPKPEPQPTRPHPIKDPLPPQQPEEDPDLQPV